MAVFDRFLADLRRWGAWRTLWHRVASRVRRWLMIARVRTRALERDAPDEETRDGIVMRHATSNDLSKACADMPEQLSEDFVEKALRRGDVCVAAFDADAMVSFSWFSFSFAPAEEGTWVQLCKPYRYVFKSYTHPDYRGLRLQRALLFLLDADHLDQGYTHTIGYVESHNYASIAAGIAAGASWVGYAGFLKCFGRIYPFSTPGAKRHSFEFLSSADH